MITPAVLWNRDGGKQGSLFIDWKLCGHMRVSGAQFWSAGLSVCLEAVPHCLYHSGFPIHLSIWQSDTEVFRFCTQHCHNLFAALDQGWWHFSGVKEVSRGYNLGIIQTIRVPFNNNSLPDQWVLGSPTIWPPITCLVVSPACSYFCAKPVVHPSQTGLPWIYSTLSCFCAFLCLCCFSSRVLSLLLGLYEKLYLQVSCQTPLSAQSLSRCPQQNMISPSLASWYHLLGLFFLSFTLLDLVWVICVPVPWGLESRGWPLLFKVSLAPQALHAAGVW